MKSLFSITTAALLILMGIGSAQAAGGTIGAENPVDEEQGQNNAGEPQYDAARFAAELPQTLIVRRDDTGRIAIYHSAEAMRSGTVVDEELQFVEEFETAAPVGDALFEQDIQWLFFWNFLAPHSYPTYRFLSSDHRFRHDYSYRPFYSYYDNERHFRYTFYRWWH